MPMHPVRTDEYDMFESDLHISYDALLFATYLLQNTNIKWVEEASSQYQEAIKHSAAVLAPGTTLHDIGCSMDTMYRSAQHILTLPKSAMQNCSSVLAYSQLNNYIKAYEGSVLPRLLQTVTYPNNPCRANTNQKTQSSCRIIF